MLQQMPCVIYTKNFWRARRRCRKRKKQMQLFIRDIAGDRYLECRRTPDRKHGKNGSFDMQKGLELAEKLECWFMAYKENWRATSKEGDLHHIAEIVFWYADWMRRK